MLKTVDWTTGNIVIYDGKKDSTIAKNEFLDWVKNLPSKTKLVGEYAHFGCPQVGMSRAQPFTEDELQELYQQCNQCGIDFRMFPQQSTARALNAYKIKKPETAKDLDRDAEAIWKLLKDHPEISLMRPQGNFYECHKRKEGYKYINALNRVLNLVRGAGTEGYTQPEDAIYQFLVNNIEDVAKELSPEALSAFNLGDDGRYKTGKINFNKIKLSQMYSILAIMLDHDGNKRIRSDTKQLPGWKFAKRYIIRMSPFHLKGGLLRSNMYWHGLRHWVAAQAATELFMKNKDGKTDAKAFKSLYRGGYKNDKGKFVRKMTKKQEQCYLKYRRQYCKAVKELYCSFKRKLEI